MVEKKGHRMEIELSKAEVDEARGYEKSVLQRVERYRPNYTGLQAKGRYFIGKIGEMAVQKWAERERVAYRATSNADGLADDQDFLFFFRDGRRCRVDVKNSLHPRADLLLLSVSQAKKHSHDLYIGATGKHDGDCIVVKLWGAATRLELMAGKIKTIRIPSYSLPLSELPHSMEKLARVATSDTAPVVF